MPGKIKVTSEMILSKALSITRQEGIDACNARRIGKELNCSLQPVYYYFGTMDKLRKEIMKEANKVYNSYIDRAKSANGKKFKAVGMNYIHFAREEKQLFKLLFMSDVKHTSKMVVEVDDNKTYIVDAIMTEYKMSMEEAEKLHFEVWVATHGIASMIATDYMHFEEEQVSMILDDICGSLIRQMKDFKND